MDVEEAKRLIERRPNLSTALGMDFISTPEGDVCKATITVDERNRQPLGILRGGASLALAESVTGVGPLAPCPDKICGDISVSGNHVKAMAEGDTVTSMTRLVSIEHKQHVGDVEITNSSDELISTVHVTNYVITPKKQADE